MNIEIGIIAILGGTGREGSGLALRWAAAGLDVILGSRQQEKAEQKAAELNRRLGQTVVRGMENRVAAMTADTIVLTVPYSAHAATLEHIKDVIQGKVLVDVTVPLRPSKVGQVWLPEGRSATEEAQALLGPGVRVVCAFQNVSAEHLQDPTHPVDCDVLVCGDDVGAKAVAIALAEKAGMRGLDAGPLQNAVVVEGLTPILIGLSRRYKIRGAGIRITGLDRER
ncbi:MAG: NADPH-dependent F420 reductase [Anaerolineae bacterium]|nr:NADPH-dependent F420 reductase [Anaerolineae bacterium]MDW8100238.1 NADPH-dependent F420 reductase [Anaerolineae bacterium]